MFSGKRTGRSTFGFTFRRASGFPRRAVANAVRYAPEALERRVLLTVYDDNFVGPLPYVPEPEAVVAPPEPLEETESPNELALFEQRLEHHTLTASDLEEKGIEDLTWQGQKLYVRRNQWIVKLDAGAAESPDARSTLDGLGFGQIYREAVGDSTTALVEVPDGVSYSHLSEALASHSLGARLGPNRVTWALSTPNDTSYASQQWSLNNTGQSSVFPGTPDADIDAPEAWEPSGSTGSRAVAVGVIDSGIDYTHADLYKNIWINQLEIPLSEKAALTDVDADGVYSFYDLNDAANAGVVPELTTDSNNYIDGADVLAHWSDGSTTDDGNGYTDDLIGWNFIGTENNIPMDATGHGTHVAGIIGAVGNNGVGVAGVAWAVSLMPLKAVGTGIGGVADAIQALAYVRWMKSHGAKVSVTNNSWGVPGVDEALDDEIDLQHDAGILFVAAAGNESTFIDSSTTQVWPASAAQDNMITVAATDRQDMLISMSNYGATDVDLAAPGAEVYSTKWGGGYELRSGTSMAAPHVAGAAALLWSKYPSKAYGEIRAALINSADVNASVYGKVASNGRLNIKRAFDYLKSVRSIPGTSGIDTSGVNSITIRLKSGDSQTVEVLGLGTTIEVSLGTYGILEIDAGASGDSFTVDPVNGSVTTPLWLYGGDGADSIQGGSGEDRIIGDPSTSSANDTLDGGAGDASDGLVGGAGVDSIVGGGGSDQLVGGSGADKLYGNAGPDVLRGDEGNDDLFGDVGDDTYAFVSLSADLGVDLIDDESQSRGTGGTDTLDLTHFGDGDLGGVTVNLSSIGGSDRATGTKVIDYGQLRLWVTDEAGGDSDNTAIENFQGTDFNDTINGNGVANVLSGELGVGLVDPTDTISGAGGNDTIFGDDPYVGPGFDIQSGDFNDQISGDAGDDILSGGTGNDRIDGGDDNDTIDGGFGNDTNLDFNTAYLLGGAGNDTVRGGPGGDGIDGGPGTDSLSGDDGPDHFYFGSAADGADVVNGNADGDIADYSQRLTGAGVTVSLNNSANDGQTDTNPAQAGNQSEGDNIKTDIETVLGGAGNDNLSGGTLPVRLDGLNGNDTLIGSSADDVLRGGDNSDVIYGMLGNDDVDGESNADQVFGDDPTGYGSSGGVDNVKGGEGTDSCYGGYGNDFVDGGDNNDLIWGDDPQFPTVGGSDTIVGGTGNDTMHGGIGNDSFFADDGGEADVLYGESGTADAAKMPGDGTSSRDDEDIIPLSDIEVLS